MPWIIRRAVDASKPAPPGAYYGQRTHKSVQPSPPSRVLPAHSIQSGGLAFQSRLEIDSEISFLHSRMSAFFQILGAYPRRLGRQFENCSNEPRERADKAE